MPSRRACNASGEWAWASPSARVFRPGIASARHCVCSPARGTILPTAPVPSRPAARAPETARLCLRTARAPASRNSSVTFAAGNPRNGARTFAAQSFRQRLQPARSSSHRLSSPSGASRMSRKTRVRARQQVERCSAPPRSTFDSDRVAVPDHVQDDFLKRRIAVVPMRAPAARTGCPLPRRRTAARRRRIARPRRENPGRPRDCETRMKNANRWPSKVLS